MSAALRPLPAAFFVVLLLAGALLTGCGGGGNSTTDEGFRFVPDGHGAVIPYADVHFEYDAGSVSSGVVVTAAPVTAGLPAAPSGASQVGSAYRITLSTSSLTFTSQARIYLPYDPAQLPAGSVPRIYFSAPVVGGAQSWQVLPVSAAAPTPAATILEALLPVTIPSGSLLTVFAGTPSGLTTLNPFFGTFRLNYAGSSTGNFSFSVAANGAVSGVSGGPAVTGTVSTSGAVSIVSGGQTYTGTLAVDAATGAVIASVAVWSGPGGTAGTWSVQ